MDALIGYTGFVGSALDRQHNFGAKYNSSTIKTLRGEKFETVVCAAAPGSMFEANRLPEQDREHIDTLVSDLETVKAKTFVLISSIAVFDRFDGQQTEASGDFETQNAYGANRRALETAISDHFENSLIVRLPALYGRGLKKNFVFDILNPVPTMLTRERFSGLMERVPDAWRPELTDMYALNSMLDMFVVDRNRLASFRYRVELEILLQEAGLSAVYFTNPASKYQFYGVQNLWRDINVARAASLTQLHLATEPVQAAEVYRALTGEKMPETGARLHLEDFRTLHAALWRRDGSYIMGASEVLEAMTSQMARGTALG
ncbi:sugar nucleotide-binding protein [Celeribacter neptunius]|uniref:RmlD substrate binding domain-containing protein n=1 Tax=Celeribacter neptunius TaxID=588602 RepID=A0A1I3YCZ7_9RHOB|nr:sugar nucleotide-binding protein [Celeribacter neptunius]SFK29613.1 RmlD substrate binding domain-containing protein [Celeribacter neptunius]